MQPVLFKYKKNIFIIIFIYLSFSELRVIETSENTYSDNSNIVLNSRQVHDIISTNSSKITNIKIQSSDIEDKHDIYFVNRILSRTKYQRDNTKIENNKNEAENNYQKITHEKVNMLEWQTNLNQFNDLDDIMSDNNSCVLELSVKHLKWWVEDDGHLSEGVTTNSLNRGKGEKTKKRIKMNMKNN